MNTFNFNDIKDSEERESARKAYDLYSQTEADLEAIEKLRLELSAKFKWITGVHLLPDGKLREDGERVWERLLAESPRQTQHQGFVAMHALRGEIGFRDPEVAMRGFLGAKYDDLVEDNGQLGTKKRLRPRANSAVPKTGIPTATGVTANPVPQATPQSITATPTL